MKSGRLLGRRSATRSCGRIVSESKKSIRERVSENGRDFVIDFDTEDGRFGNPQSYKAYVREPDYPLSYLACVELSPDGSVSVDRWFRTGKDDFEPEDYPRTTLSERSSPWSHFTQWSAPNPEGSAISSTPGRSLGIPPRGRPWHVHR